MKKVIAGLALSTSLIGSSLFMSMPAANAAPTQNPTSHSQTAHPHQSKTESQKRENKLAQALGVTPNALEKAQETIRNQHEEALAKDMNVSPEKLRQALKEYKGYKGVNKKDLAKALNVNEDTVRSAFKKEHEIARSNPDLRASELAKALNLDVNKVKEALKSEESHHHNKQHR